ncbi:MAG: DNA-binding protein [Candidatus Thermoplasmatota archaeon]|jgi:programmed cell death protein 5|nr:DNA-binding protein [Candidatus Thermoplasmatota archaeon]
MDNDDELEALRRRKLEEMQRGASQEQYEEQKKAAETERAKRQALLRQILSPEARDRLSNVRLVRPDLAEDVENQLIQLARMGRLNRVVKDEDVKDILEKLTSTKKETRIERR